MLFRSIVIMDLRSNILYMARDRFGIKPLYYSDVDNKIFFASEIKSIIQFKDLKKELDLDAYNARIIFSRPSDQVLVKNVNMLDPGWALIVSPNGNIRKWQFWDIDSYERQNKYKNVDEAIDVLDGILTDAVARQLVSDVKVGCQISGGIDSTLVSYYANKADISYLNDGVSIVDNTLIGGVEEHYIDIVSNILNLDEHKFKMEIGRASCRERV